jgi:hypothetical protein
VCIASPIHFTRTYLLFAAVPGSLQKIITEWSRIERNISERPLLGMWRRKTQSVLRASQFHQRWSKRMAILDDLLGGSTDLDAVIGTNPQVGLGVSDVLSVGTGDDGGIGLTGVGELSLGIAAPTFVGVSASHEGDGSDDSGGGLLGGLL